MLDPEIPRDAGALEEPLADWLRAQGSVLVGYSGGVDSAYLACVAVDILGPENVLAVIGRSASYPDAQWGVARDVARRFGIPLEELATNELADDRYAANPSNRCYFCKHELWGKLVPLAQERGIAVVIDGTNADDVLGHRPGALAAREQGVQSPLADLGFTKNEIRSLSRARDIPTWSQPSSPCLSSRIPYGTAVTPERLARIGKAEQRLRDIGVAGDMRVRYHGDLARVELSRVVLADWLRPERSAVLRDAIRSAGFTDVEIDPRGYRSGSLNVLETPLQSATLRRD